MLIDCVAYQEGKKLQDITVEAISDYVSKPDCFVWVALQDADKEELAKMQEEFGLHELAVEDALHGHQRPKIEEYGDSLFAVLHMAEQEGNELVIGELSIFVGPNYVLSVRKHARESFLGVRARCEREPHLLSHGSGFVLYALMDAVVDRYYPVLDSLETELEQIEDRMFGVQETQSINIHKLYELKQRVAILRHAVEPLMESVGRLYGGRVPAVCANSGEYFRDIHDHLYQINIAIDNIRETISTAIQAHLSLAAVEESRITKRLAGWAAIFAVATAFAGIWGMNFKFMPELDWRFGYPLALAIMAVICGYLYYRFRKSGWL